MNGVRVLPGMPMGAGAEFDAIRRLLARWGPRATGIGDDAAVLAMERRGVLVASVDASIEHVHFRREWLTPREIGWRAVAAALSDLAAMGAEPSGILLALVLPRAWRGEIDELAEGIGEAAEFAGAPIVGGNIADGEALSITTTVLGEAERPLRRAGARAGDRLYVTGRLGGPRAALEAFQAGRAPASAHRERFAHPEPRLAAARWLATHGAHAAIDISDGLRADAAHLAAASAVAIELHASAVPCIEGVSVDDALVSGEEYELLVTAAAPLDTATFETLFGIPLTAVGVAHAGPPVVTVRDGGVRVDNAPGHDHLSP